MSLLWKLSVFNVTAVEIELAALQVIEPAVELESAVLQWVIFGLGKPQKQFFS